LGTGVSEFNIDSDAITNTNVSKRHYEHDPAAVDSHIAKVEPTNGIQALKKPFGPLMVRRSRQGKRSNPKNPKKRKNFAKHHKRGCSPLPLTRPQRDTRSFFYAIQHDQGYGSMMLNVLDDKANFDAEEKCKILVYVVNREAQNDMQAGLITVLALKTLRLTIKANPAPFVAFLSRHFDQVEQYGALYASAKPATNEPPSTSALLWRRWPASLKLFAIATGTKLACYLRDAIVNPLKPTKEEEEAIKVAGYLAPAQRRWARTYHKQGKRLQKYEEKLLEATLEHIQLEDLIFEL
jgi:hypothetical protein